MICAQLALGFVQGHEALYELVRETLACVVLVNALVASCFDEEWERRSRYRR